MPEHAFDPETCFCTRCDTSLEEFVDAGGWNDASAVPCIEAENTLSFRHYRCRQWIDATCEAVLQVMRKG